MSFPAKNKSQIPRLLIALLTFSIILATVVINALLRRNVEVSERDEITLLRLQALAYHLSALEWQAISERKLSSEVLDDMQRTKEEMGQAIGSLEQADERDNLYLVRLAYADYLSATDEEFKLIAAGDLEEARRVDEEKVDPAFEDLTQALTAAGEGYRARVIQMERLSDTGSTLVPLLAAIAMAVLFWRVQKAQAVIEAASVEQRTLSRSQETFHILSEMGNWLQACHTTGEAYKIIADFCARLFPNESGALYIYNSSRNVLEAVTHWGEFPEHLPSPVLSPDECWALRRAQIYIVEDTAAHGVLCQHLGHPGPGSYLCVPMMARGETLGILHLRGDRPPLVPEAHPADSLGRPSGQLAVTVSEHIALALINLKLQDSLRDQAIRDPLTNLFNRRYMEESLEREFARAARRNSPVGIVMLDIDHFKLFNDTFGHSAGDKVLVELSSLMQARVRREDIACRFGGEEFVLVLPEASLDDTCRRAEQLLMDIPNLSVLHKGQVLGAITLSIGVACFPEHGKTAEGLLAAADAALYDAKAQGRNRLVVARTGSGGS